MIKQKDANFTFITLQQKQNIYIYLMIKLGFIYASVICLNENKIQLDCAMMGIFQ